DAIQPVIPAHEIAAGPAQHGEAQRPRRLQHVATETTGVGQRRGLVVDAPVDAAAEVLDELTEDPPVDGTDAALAIDGDARHARSLPRRPRSLTHFADCP